MANINQGPAAENKWNSVNIIRLPGAMGRRPRESWQPARKADRTQADGIYHYGVPQDASINQDRVMESLWNSAREISLGRPGCLLAASKKSGQLGRRRSNKQIGETLATRQGPIMENTEQAAGTNADPGSTSLLLLSAAQAAARCCITLRTWRTWDSGGQIPRPVRIGRSIFWRADELRAWIDAGCPRRQDWDVLRDPR